MTVKTPIRARPRMGERRGFLESLLDPIDRLSETIFSILAVSTFTLAYKIFRLSGDPTHMSSAEFSEDLLVGALGATIAWGLIDGIMYALISMFERGEKHRLLKRIQTAATREEGIQAIAEELDHILEPITGLEKRQMLYADVLEHLQDSRPQPVRLTRADLAGAVGSLLVAIMAVIPSLSPLVILSHDYVLAIRVSNLVSFVVLFIAGVHWGRYTGSNPWKTGLLLAVVSAVMVLIAIPLGG
jgi:hypothetical protein